MKAAEEKDRLFDMFQKQGISHSFKEESVRTVYDLLFTKMLNLRKKDMQTSWERIQTHKKGGKAITLNLRDELKPYATKRKKSKQKTK